MHPLNNQKEITELLEKQIFLGETQKKIYENQIKINNKLKIIMVVTVIISLINVIANIINIF